MCDVRQNDVTLSSKSWFDTAGDVDLGMAVDPPPPGGILATMIFLYYNA